MDINFLKIYVLGKKGWNTIYFDYKMDNTKNIYLENISETTFQHYISYLFSVEHVQYSLVNIDSIY